MAGDRGREEEEGHPLLKRDPATLQKKNAKQNDDNLLENGNRLSDGGCRTFHLDGVKVGLKKVLGSTLPVFQLLFLCPEILDQGKVLHPLGQIPGERADSRINARLGFVIPPAYHNHLDVPERQRKQDG